MCESDTRNLKVLPWAKYIIRTPYTAITSPWVTQNNFVPFRFDSGKLCIVPFLVRRTPKKRACSAIDQEPWSSSTSRHFSPSLGRPWRPHAPSVESQLAGARQRLPKHPRGSAVERVYFHPTCSDDRPNIGATMTRKRPADR